MDAARRYLVSGLVQGVGYRYWVLKRARERAVTGFVRNLHDGKVEVLAEGTEEALSALRGDLEVGPSFSKVARVEEIRSEPTGQYAGFTIER